jgi:hypothetical protein
MYVRRCHCDGPMGGGLDARGKRWYTCILNRIGKFCLDTVIYDHS